MTAFVASLAGSSLLVRWRAVPFVASARALDAGEGCAMNDRIPGRERYFQLVEEARTLLDNQLDRIWNDCNDGTITVRQAADARVQVMTEHLARLKQLREEFLL